MAGLRRANRQHSTAPTEMGDLDEAAHLLLRQQNLRLQSSPNNVQQITTIAQ